MLRQDHHEMALATQQLQTLVAPPLINLVPQLVHQIGERRKIVDLSDAAPKAYAKIMKELPAFHRAASDALKAMNRGMEAVESSSCNDDIDIVLERYKETSNCRLRILLAWFGEDSAPEAPKDAAPSEGQDSSMVYYMRS